MTETGWQSTVQTDFALDIYKELWPGCQIHENDTYGQTEKTAKILDFGDVDKIIRISGIQKQMAQRFRKPYNGGNHPDFTLRYSRPSSDNVVEHERLMTAHAREGASYPRRYAFGRVYDDHSKGIYQMYILDVDELIEGIKSGVIEEDGPIKNDEGQEMMAYKLGDIRGVGAVVKQWSRQDSSRETDGGTKTAVTMYSCTVCGERKPIPGQRPLTPEPSISVGCQNCERIQTHTPQGVR